MAVGQDTCGLSPSFTELLPFRVVSLFSSNTKLTGENQRNFRGFTLARGSCSEHFNGSVFVYRDAQSRLAHNPGITQSPLPSHSKDNVRQDTSTGMQGGLDPHAPAAGASQPMLLMA